MTAGPGSGFREPDSEIRTAKSRVGHRGPGPWTRSSRPTVRVRESGFRGSGSGGEGSPDKAPGFQHPGPGPRGPESWIRASERGVQVLCTGIRTLGPGVDTGRSMSGEPGSGNPTRRVDDPHAGQGGEGSTVFRAGATLERYMRDPRVCLPIGLPACPAVCLSIGLSVCRFAGMSACRSVGFLSRGGPGDSVARRVRHAQLKTR